MNDADAASITRNEIIMSGTPWRSAASAAMGNISAADNEGPVQYDQAVR